MIQGYVEENVSSSEIDVTRYPTEHVHYTEFGVPEGWPDGSHLFGSGWSSSRGKDRIWPDI